MTRSVGPMALGSVVLAAAAALAQVQPRTARPDPAIERAIARGIQYLREAAPNEGDSGRKGLATLALLKSGQDPNDPLVAKLVAELRSRVRSGVYRPGSEREGNYEAAVTLMALVSAGHDEHLQEIQAITQYLLKRQTPEGAWDYPESTGGDTSMTQYGLLGLWEAASVGIDIPIGAWDKALHWLITTQLPEGGFTYHPKEGQNPTHTMGVAGAGSMIICRSRLPFRPLPVKKKKPTSSDEFDLLILVIEEDPEDPTKPPPYEPKVTQTMADQAIAKANGWMANNITDEGSGLTVLYYLYGLERYAALAALERVGKADWYALGARYIVQKQAENGSWSDTFGDSVGTSFALMFLGKATEKSIARIRKLGKGTMLGGRGLPSPDGPPPGVLALRRPRYRTPSKASVEDLLAALTNDPDSASVDGLAAALEAADPKTLLAAAGNKARDLRRLARHENSHVRQAALWALARTKDYRVAPVLIEALADPDLLVYQAARDSLRFLARSADPLGLPEYKADPQKIADGIRRWQEWFASLAIELDPEQQYEE